MSGRALDLTDASAHTGANVQLYAYNSSCAQRWKFLSSSNGAYVIASSCNNGYVLDISNGVVEDRTNIQVWPKNGTYAQGWKLTSL